MGKFREKNEFCQKFSHRKWEQLGKNTKISRNVLMIFPSVGVKKSNILVERVSKIQYVGMRGGFKNIYFCRRTHSLASFWYEVKQVW